MSVTASGEVCVSLSPLSLHPSNLWGNTDQIWRGGMGAGTRWRCEVPSSSPRRVCLGTGRRAALALPAPAGLRGELGEPRAESASGATRLPRVAEEQMRRGASPTHGAGGRRGWEESPPPRRSETVLKTVEVREAAGGSCGGWRGVQRAGMPLEEVGGDKGSVGQRGCGGKWDPRNVTRPSQHGLVSFLPYHCGSAVLWQIVCIYPVISQDFGQYFILNWFYSAFPTA